jgi:hypothetical protein
MCFFILLFAFSPISTTNWLFIVKRIKEKDHHDIACTTQLLSINISVCHILIIIFILLLSILFSFSLHHVLLFCILTPPEGVARNRLFFSSILPDGRRSICFFILLYSVVHSRVQSMERKKKLPSFCRIPILNACFSVQEGRIFPWLCFKIISFS